MLCFDNMVTPHQPLLLVIEVPALGMRHQASMLLLADACQL